MWPFKKKTPELEETERPTVYRSSFSIEVHLKNGNSEMFGPIRDPRDFHVVNGFLQMQLYNAEEGSPQLVNIAVGEIKEWDVYTHWVKEQTGG